MVVRWPGTRLRPHVKAFKSAALAKRLAPNGHTGFCCATIREIEGMAAAGLGTDLLLANEVLDARDRHTESAICSEPAGTERCPRSAARQPGFAQHGPPDTCVATRLGARR